MSHAALLARAKLCTHAHTLIHDSNRAHNDRRRRFLVALALLLCQIRHYRITTTPYKALDINYNE